MNLANPNPGPLDSILGSQVSAMEDALTFAHFSDPHLSSLENVQIKALFNKRVLGYLSWRGRRRNEHRREVLAALVSDLQQRQPEHVVITGDLTHLGLPSEFQQTSQWLRGLGSATQVTVVPGNHDTYIRMPWGHTLAAWVPYMISDDQSDGVAETDSISLFPSLRVRGPVAFIGLSSACPAAPFRATGRVGREQLQRLEALLVKTGQENLFRVVLIHHPPLPGVVSSHKRLLDNAPLRSILVRYGVELVLHGHAHRTTWEQLQTRSGASPVVGVSSASACGHRSGRPAQYCMYRVQRGPCDWILQSQARNYSPTQECFTDGPHKQWCLPFSYKGLMEV